jgi:hypothetical protein
LSQGPFVNEHARPKIPQHCAYEFTSNAGARQSHTIKEDYTVAFAGWPFILWQNALLSVLEKCIIMSGKLTEMTFARRKTKHKKMNAHRTATARLWASALTLSVFVVALPILIPGAGCSPAEAPVTVIETEPNESSRPVIEPDEAEPAIAPDTVKPKPWPDVPEVNMVEPNEGQVQVTEPNEPEKGEPNQPEPNAITPRPVVTFHDKCNSILSKFVDDEGMVDYAKLKLKRTQLDALLHEFAKLDRDEYKRWVKEDKIALWINAYNLQMLKIIVRNYPIKSSRFLRLMWPPTSIRHIEPTDAIGVKKWDRHKFLVMDEEFTLSEIERELFRKGFNEPRVFLALTQACMSGPPLRNAPYTGRKLNEQLDDQVRKFMTSPRAFKIDRENQKAFLSGLFHPTWYGKDFVKKYDTDKKFKSRTTTVRAVLNFITGYLPPRDKAFLDTEYYTVGYIRFDWRLNDAAEDD